MNSTFKCYLIMLALLAAGGASAAEQKEPAPKIAFLDMERVFDEYHKTKAANIQFKARGEEIDARRKEFVAKARSLKADFEKLNAESRDKTLNDKAREKKREEAEDKLAELRAAEEKLMEVDKGYKKEIADQMRQLQQQIVGEIRGVVRTYTAEHKINIVFDSSGKTLNNVEGVVYFDKPMDITEAILAIMNKNAPEAEPKTTEKKSDHK